MATFTSKPTVIPSSAQAVADRFSDFTQLQSFIDAMPEAERQKVGDIALTSDSIILKTPQVGNITLKVKERTAHKIALEAEGSPVPMLLSIDLKSIDDSHTELTTSMEVDIPAFLKPMIGGTMQKAVDQFGDLMKRLA